MINFNLPASSFLFRGTGWVFQQNKNDKNIDKRAVDDGKRGKVSASFLFPFPSFPVLF